MRSFFITICLWLCLIPHGAACFKPGMIIIEKPPKSASTPFVEGVAECCEKMGGKVFHVCMVVDSNHVIESIRSKGVVKTPLKVFQKRTNGRIIRMELADESKVNDAIAYLWKHVGKPYNHSFSGNTQHAFTEEKFSCSDLIAAALMHAYEKPIVPLHKMAFASSYWNAYFEELGEEPGEWGTSPANFLTCDFLREVR